MPRQRIEINPIRGERLKQLMKSVGINETTLAGLMHYHKGHISFIVSGKRNMTEEFAKRVVELFPAYRFEWLMGIDDYPTDEEKNLSDKKNSHIQDVINSINKMQLYRCKVEALEQYFSYYSIDVLPPLGVLYSDDTISEAKNNRLQGDIDGIDIVPEDTLFVIVQSAHGDSWRCNDYKDDKERIIGVCKGSDLLELADSLLEYAEFKMKKFAKQTQEMLKEKRNSYGEIEVGNAFTRGILSKDRYTTKQMLMYRDISKAYFESSKNSSIAYYTSTEKEGSNEN